MTEKHFPDGTVYLCHNLAQWQSIDDAVILGMNRQSNFRGPVATNKSRNNGSQSIGDSEKGMWSSMLDSVASGKKLPEKNLLVLGWSIMVIVKN